MLRFYSLNTDVTREVFAFTFCLLVNPRSVLHLTAVLFFAIVSILFFFFRSSSPFLVSFSTLFFSFSVNATLTLPLSLSYQISFNPPPYGRLTTVATSLRLQVITFSFLVLAGLPLSSLIACTWPSHD